MVLSSLGLPINSHKKEAPLSQTSFSVFVRNHNGDSSSKIPSIQVPIESPPLSSVETKNREIQKILDLDVSETRGIPKSSHFNRGFHYKPSILGVPLFLETAKGISLFMINFKTHLLSTEYLCKFVRSHCSNLLDTSLRR